MEVLMVGTEQTYTLLRDYCISNHMGGEGKYRTSLGIDDFNHHHLLMPSPEELKRNLAPITANHLQDSPRLPSRGIFRIISLHTPHIS